MTSIAHKMNRGPLILAIILLLLPMLYVGSYLALVVPGCIFVQESPNSKVAVHYRVAGNDGAGWVYWPLERIDRRIRSTSWAGEPGGPPLIRRLSIK